MPTDRTSSISAPAGKTERSAMISAYARLPVLFWSFFKISALTVGGGLTMIPVMEREFIDRRAWLTAEDMVDTLALVQSMPGVIAVNMALMIGYRTAGIPGAMTAAAGVTLPPFLVILAVAAFFRTLSSSETMSHIFRGVRAAVCALILLSAVNMGKKLLKAPFPWFTAVLSFLIFLLLPQVNVVYVILAAGIAGLIRERFIAGEAR